MTYKIYLIQNVNQIDLFGIVSKHFHFGMDQSSTLIAGSHIAKYSHIFQLWPEWEELQLGRAWRVMEFP